MYIYLPNGFILFPKIWGEFVESIVTSINGYFLVTVRENVCVLFFFSFLWFFCFVFRVKHRMFFGFFLSSLWPMTFSARYYFRSAF